MKKLILVLTVFITTTIFSQDLCVYFKKERTWIKGNQVWLAQDKQINDKLKELGENWEIKFISSDNYGCYVVFTDKK